ncbi:MAG: hypothetical protein IJO20_08070 [Ruminococcus sp.]|nr:hypothetical protein [Ruminococcus sp.]
MKFRWLIRTVSLILTVCILLTIYPFTSSVIVADAIGSVNSLTCSGFISNATARNYIDTMMRHYINSSYTLQSTLDNGQSVVFMFEGGSDNYWNGTTYSDNDYASRTQAVCIVVKKNSAGNAYIDYYCENSSSIPAEPSWCTNGVAYSGSTTLMDGTYAFYTWNHTGPYAAFQIDLSSSNGYCYYTPSANPNGYKAGASGINIHTRSTAYNGGSSIGWAWSEGCQVIGYGNDYTNEFNAFMKSVAGITWNPWISWNPKSLQTWASTGTYKGYFVVDRQLGMIGTNGAQYGTGSLINLYNTTALTNITANSTAAKKAAGISDTVDYVSQCTLYPSYGKLVCTGTDVWTRTLPCYASVNSSTAAISAYNSGDVLTCTGVVKNTVGEYWYRVLSSTGSHLYVRAAYMDFKEQYLTDITLTDHTKPNGHIYNTGFIVDGKITTTYNELTAVSAYVHNGFGTTGATSTGYRATISGNSYTLANSVVDSNVWMNLVPLGANTMVIKAEYKSCYVQDDTTLKTNTGAVILAEDYFMVIESSVSQSGCSHNYTTYVIDGGNYDCTTTAQTLKGCTICGLLGTITDSTGSHSYGDWVVTDASCTQQGTKVRTCSKCGASESSQIPPTGHNYTSVTKDATCIEYEKIIHTCTNCNDTYTTVIAPEYSEWSETFPEGVASSLIESKTQYRYSDYITITSAEPAVSGYTQLSKTWVSQGQKSQECVKSWDSGYNTSHTLYSQYNKTPVTTTAGDNYSKTELNSEKIVGYIYYHWCSGLYNDGPYNRTTSKTQTDYYKAFHSFYSTKSPSESEREASDGSVIYSNLSCCGDSYWYYNIPVYNQTYTTYKASYTHGGWSEYSNWSDTKYIASDTRKVETRTVYRHALGVQMGDHNYVNGTCTVCGRKEAADQMYLFGFINGADYGYMDDADTIGIYKFTDGKLVTGFSENSYVGVKNGDNSAWYMAENYPGDNATSTLLVNADGLENPEKLFVPGGKQITFTLTDNKDGTYTLSYEVGECTHREHNLSGNCTLCGEEVGHSFSSGACTECGKPCSHNYENGVCTSCTFVCRHSFYKGECVVCKLPCQHDFEDGVCTICSAGCDHIWENCICTVCKATCKHNFEDSVCTECSKVCDHTFSQGSCASCAKPCSHNYENGQCTVCSITCTHKWYEGQCVICSYICENHNYVNNNCTICNKGLSELCLFGIINGKNYGCGEDIDNAGIYKFVNGKLNAVFAQDSFVAVKRSDNSQWFMTDEVTDENTTSVTLYNSDTPDSGNTLFVPKGRLVTFTLTDNGDGTYTLSYEALPCAHAKHDANGMCQTCGKEVGHTFTDGFCRICAKACEHTFSNGVCTICSRVCDHYWSQGKCIYCNVICEHTFSDSVCTKCNYLCEHNFSGEKCTECSKTYMYYLAGYINSENVGCEENFDFTGTYLFENRQLTLDFYTDSYVFVKTQDNQNWYMAENSIKTQSTVLVNTANGGSHMVFIPAGVSVTFTLSFNDDGSLTLDYAVNSCNHTNHDKDAVCTVCEAETHHSFANGYCTVCKAKELVENEAVPEIVTKYAYLNMDNTFHYSVVYSVLNLEDVNPLDMGLLMFTSKEGDLTYDYASSVISGASVSGDNFEVNTNEIHPKALGDTVYLRVYVKLADSSYVYSEIISYSGAQYSYSMLRNPASTKSEKAYAVSLLNFVSAMQIYWDYNTESLANANLTDEEKALVSDFTVNMADKIPQVDSNKAVNFEKNTKSSILYPTVDINSNLFTLNYNLKIKETTASSITLYYWSADTYEISDVLTKENANGKITMYLAEDGIYRADITDIGLMGMNNALYTSVVYEAEGTNYCTGINAYSLAQYLAANADNSDARLSTLAQASVVYGYYAKNLFDVV